MFAMPESEHNCPQLLLAENKGQNHLKVPIWTPFGHRLVGWERHQSSRRNSPWPPRGWGGHQPGSQKEDQIAVLRVPEGKAARTSKYLQMCLGNQTQGWGVCLSYVRKEMMGRQHGRGTAGFASSVCRPELGGLCGVVSPPHGFSWEVTQPCLCFYCLLFYYCYSTGD